MRLKRLSENEVFSKMKSLTSSRQYLGFYSSLIDGFIDDPALMFVPIDDHAVVRGHAIFDTATVVQGHFYRFETHLQRALKSAQDSRITLPFEPDIIREKIMHTVAMTQLQNAFVRYYITAGPGNFSWLPYDCQSALYVVVTKDAALEPLEQALIGQTEFVGETPMKNHPLTEIKTNNYLMNVLIGMESYEQGGLMGIWVNPEGFLMEGCVANVVSIKGNELRTPPFENILRGCTLRRVLEIAQGCEEFDVVTQRPVHVEELFDSDEIFMCGGDLHFRPITVLKSKAFPEGRQIGSGKVGFKTTKLVDLIRADATSFPSENHIKVPYELYKPNVNSTGNAKL